MINVRASFEMSQNLLFHTYVHSVYNSETMKTKQVKSQLGVWMDHSSAKLIQLKGHIVEIESESKHGVGQETDKVTRLGNHRSSNNETHKHNREINSQHEFFNELYDAIKSDDEVIIFGPSTAPNEFHNYILKHEKQIRGKINIEKSDYMTDNQLVEYVNNYFLSGNS